MKRNSMKVPPLSQLYEQKIDFNAHRRKLQKIMTDRKANLQRQLQNKTQETIIRRNLNHYSLKFNTKSLEIAKENSKIIRKIQSIKPAYGFRQSLDLAEKDARSSHMINSRSKVVEQERENYRLRERVQSMNASLNNRKMLEDYRRSMQIKNRISHYRTEENRVTLKAEKYLGNSSVQSLKSKSQKMFHQIIESPESLPAIESGIGKQLIDRKLSKNTALYYNKDDIVKNKIKINNKLFKYSRQKRLKILLNQQKADINQESLAAIKSNNSAFFPTQPQKTNK